MLFSKHVATDAAVVAAACVMCVRVRLGVCECVRVYACVHVYLCVSVCLRV